MSLQFLKLNNYLNMYTVILSLGQSNDKEIIK